MGRVKTIVQLMALVFILAFYGFSVPDQRHLGEWVGIQRGDTGIIILNRGNIAEFIINNEVMGGDGFEVNGVKAVLQYEIDYTKDPIWLDFVVYEAGQEQEKGRIKGIARFLSDTQMELRVSFDSSIDRFLAFDSEDTNTIILNKVMK